MTWALLARFPMKTPRLSLVPQSPPTNRILAAIPSEEMQLLQPHLETVPLELRQNLYEMNSPVEYVYFVHRGVISMLTTMPEGIAVEIATVGPEGMVGMPIFLGADQMPSKAFAQVPGEAMRIEAQAFRHVIKECPTLHTLLLRYTLALMNQIAQNAACNRT